MAAATATDVTKTAVPKTRIRKAKAMKDPTKPKRPTSAYFYYAQEARVTLVKENPGKGVGEIAKLTGAAWGVLTDVQKKPYVAMGAKDKARYEKEKADWVPATEQ